MNFFNRLSKGWDIAKTSLQTINENRSLLLFPVISSISLIVVLLTFFGGMFFLVGDSIDAALENGNEVLGYALIFIYYFFSYFIMVFFNAALIHCSIEIFDGKKTSVRSGLNYAVSKVGKIFTWAALSATVGVILQMIHQTGKIGQFIAALIGGAWSILTFFVVPILIYEDKNVFASVNASKDILREKWGESLGGSVSFGLMQVIGMIAGVGAFFALMNLNVFLAIIIAGMILLLTFTITSAARTVFVAAVYNHINEQPTGHFEDGALDNVFFSK